MSTNKKVFNKLFLLSIILIIILVMTVFAFIELNKKQKFEKNVNGDKEIQVTIPDNESSVKSVRPISEIDHVWGEVSAPVQLIIYDDFECPFCLKFYNTTKQIKDEFGGNVVIAFRHYPLIFHVNAIPSALASECAAEQDKFWQMYDKLFDDNKNKNLNLEQYKKDAADLELDQVKFNQCLEKEVYKDKILAQTAEGKNAGVNGTPTIFLNGRLLPGAVPFEDYVGRDGGQYQGMKSLINEELGIKI